MVNKKEFWGLLLLIVGIVLLISNLDFLDYSVRRFMRDLWPLILIVIGIALIVRYAKGQKSSEDATQVFSGGQTIGQTSKVFGDLNINLKDSEIDGLNFDTTFGDIPSTWPGQN